MRMPGVLLLAGCSFEPLAASDASVVPPGPDAAIDAAADAVLPVTCPERYIEEFGGHSYLAAPARTRAAAVEECALDGGHLIKIETLDEALELAARIDILIAPRDVWIGLADAGAGYVWHDGTAPVFQHWDGQPPDGDDPDCVAAETIDGDGTWHALDCAAPRLVICECDGM